LVVFGRFIESFPIQSAKFPELAKKGAYRFPSATYSAKQVEHIVNYAKERGIRVVAEFDVPGHTASWGTTLNATFLTHTET
jgi:hexosaminidase